MWQVAFMGMPTNESIFHWLHIHVYTYVQSTCKQTPLSSPPLFHNRSHWSESMETTTLGRRNETSFPCDRDENLLEQYVPLKIQEISSCVKEVRKLALKMWSPGGTYSWPVLQCMYRIASNRGLLQKEARVRTCS